MYTGAEELRRTTRVHRASHQPRGPQGDSSFRKQDGRPLETARRGLHVEHFTVCLSVAGCQAPPMGAGSTPTGTRTRQQEVGPRGDTVGPGRSGPEPCPGWPPSPDHRLTWCTTGLDCRFPTSLRGPSAAADTQERRPPTALGFSSSGGAAGPSCCSCRGPSTGDPAGRLPRGPGTK